MADVQETLEEANRISGAIGAAIVDHENGMCLGTEGGGNRIDLEIAAAGNTEVVRAKHRVMKELGIDGDIDDILITVADQFHLIRPIPKTTLFMYLALDRERGNLALARHKLHDIESRLKV